MIHKSIVFAANVHIGQFRKGTNLPYIVHPLEVAQILSGIQAPEEVVTAGVLHDTLEDTAVSHDDLARCFGEYVASLVSECSNFHTGPWRARKQQTITKLATVWDPNVAWILCADKLSNLRSIVYDVKTTGQKIWTRFSAPQEDVIWYYGELKETLAARLDIPAALTDEYVALYTALLEITG